MQVSFKKFKFVLLASCLALACFFNVANAAKLRVMVFAPHPDDELIGCGGSIAKHVKNGNEVFVVYMTSGDSGSLKYSKTELAKLREDEARRGLEILGVKKFTFLRNPDGYLESNKENLVKTLSLIREYKPNIIYLPQADEGHPDHRKTHEIATSAAGRAPGPWFQEATGGMWGVSTILAYEVHPPMKETSYCEDITDYVDLKVRALEEHVTQLEDISYDKASESLAYYRGILTARTKRAAECFKVLQADKLF